MIRGSHSGQFVKKIGAYATSAAARPEAAASSGVTVEKLPSGVTVASVDRKWPISRISVLFRAGSRYENRDTRGISHLIRRATGLSTAGHTGLTLTRSLMQMGAGLQCAATREHIIYSVDVSGDQAEDAFEFLANSATRPLFYHWELGDSTYKHMQRDIEHLHRRDHSALLFDRLHEAAFRNTLGRSLYAPAHKIGDISYELIQQYMGTYYTPDRCTVVGVGLEHAELVDLVDTLTFPDPGPALPNDEAAKFRGGEVRLECPTPVTQVAIVSEGAAMTDEAGSLALGVLAHALGHGGPNVMWGGNNSPLAQAIAGACSQPAFASTVNLSYSDSGAFGFCVSGSGQEMEGAVKAARGVVVGAAKSGLKAEDVQRGKNQLKTALLLGSESVTNTVDDVGVQASLLGKYTSAKELAAKVDAVSADQVNEAAKKLLTPRAAVAAVGDVQDVPHLADFV